MKLVMWPYDEKVRAIENRTHEIWNVQRVYQDENDIKGEENDGQREQEERVGSKTNCV